MDGTLIGAMVRQARHRGAACSPSGARC